MTTKCANCGHPIRIIEDNTAFKGKWLHRRDCDADFAGKNTKCSLCDCTNPEPRTPCDTMN